MTWWQEPIDVILPDGFTYVGPAPLAGSYDKHFFVSKKNGKTYLWKSGKRKLGMVSKVTGKPRAAKSRDKEFTQPNAEYFASRAASAVLEPGEHIPVIKLPFPFEGVEGVERGTLGVLMPFLSDAEANSLGDNYTTKLMPDDIRMIQRMHVFDYLVSNMDTHSESTLRVGGKIIGIDRGQAMRYLSKILNATFTKDADTLDRTRTPVGAKSYYNEFFTRVKEGKIVAPISNVKDILDKIENISDDTWREWMVDYLEAFKTKYLVAMKSQPVGKPGNKTYWKGLTPEEIDSDIEGIADEMVRRKNNIRNDVVKFYKNLTSMNESAKKFLLSHDSLRDEVTVTVDEMVATILNDVTDDWRSTVRHADDADTAYEASMQSRLGTKALYYKALSNCLDSLVGKEKPTPESMMRSVVKIASRWKKNAFDIIDDLTEDNILAIRSARRKEIEAGLHDAFAQSEESWVLVYQAAYNIKTDIGKIAGTDT
jgi:hypothetical protein